MPLTKEFKAILDDFSRELGENLLFIALFTPDGISLYDSLSEEVSKEFFLASGAAILEISKSLSESSGLGKLEICHLRAKNGDAILLPVEEDVYLGIGVKDYRKIEEKVDSLASTLASFLSSR